jgi:hypothetical protein
MRGKYSLISLSLIALLFLALITAKCEQPENTPLEQNAEPEPEDTYTPTNHLSPA